MSHALPNEVARRAIQPENVEIHFAGGLFVKQMRFAEANTYIPQHAHGSDHLSMLARGSVRVWEDGKYVGDRVAPTGIMIRAGVKHVFMSLQPETIIYCIHNIGDRDYPEITAKNHLVPAASGDAAAQSMENRHALRRSD